MISLTPKTPFRSAGLIALGLCFAIVVSSVRGTADEIPGRLGTFEPQGPVLGGVSKATQADKSQFHLFKPTPKELLRDMNALYNGPYTVDAGHVQVESVLGLYAHDHYTGDGSDVTTRFLSLASTTIRLGLLNNWDLGVTVPPHIVLKTHDHIAGSHRTQSGVGDTVLRSKLNFWGDDGGSTAFGLVTFAKLPTSQDGIGNEHVEGGVAFPVALELPRGWWLGITPEFQCFHDVNDRGYHMNFASTVFLWHPIVGNLSGYVESANWVSAEPGSPWISTLDLGFTYVWGRHVQLDLGTYIGLTRAANDITPFFGFSFRF
jgi:Putative MetA-pathway of phenol degradation